MIKHKRGWKARITRSSYLIGAISFLILEYYLFVFQFMREKLQFELLSSVCILVFFHGLLIMLIWSMFQTVTSDPGKVPLYWGVIMDDPETKKRRYCLICHQFKPERSHHCSTCERCVLNMDHHCPWIMNCIGFHNRKYFILMVFYISLTAVYTLVFELLFGYEIMSRHLENITYLNIFFKIIGILISLIFACIIINFLNFHVQMLLKNTTTIENLEKQKKEQEGEVSLQPNPFDYGYQYNLYQVFGLNPYLWLIPLFAHSGKPLGDGVTWNKFPLQPEYQQNMNINYMQHMQIHPYQDQQQTQGYVSRHL